MNIIAAPKMGKSWLAYGLGLSIGTGGDWLGFPCHPGRVLLIDYELHGPTVASRLKTVADAKGLRTADYAGRLHVQTLRGRLTDLNGIARRLFKLVPGSFDVVILDAFYRSLPVGASENDNATIAGLYNTIDAVAQRLQCSWINIHHTSRGGPI